MTDLITSDARAPAPEFRELLAELAHPAPYPADAEPDYKRAVDRVAAAFGGAAIPFHEPHWQNARLRSVEFGGAPQCPHGEPLNTCADCKREHLEVTR